jgi:hypothetical protein
VVARPASSRESRAVFGRVLPVSVAPAPQKCGSPPRVGKRLDRYHRNIGNDPLGGRASKTSPEEDPLIELRREVLYEDGLVGARYPTG